MEKQEIQNDGKDSQSYMHEVRLNKLLHISDEDIIIDRLPLTTEYFELLSTIHKEFGPLNGVNLPETVVLVKGVPISWYHTKDDGTIHKRKKESLTNEMIIKKFCTGVKPTQPVAYFILFEGINTMDLSEGLQYKILYFFKDDLVTFLSKMTEQTFGYLQKFVMPFQDHNSVYVYRYCYSKTVMEYLVCRQRIDDLRYSIYERCATFERNLALTDNRIVKLDVVQDIFREISKRIINHIKDSTEDSIIIRSATFHFKIDIYGKIWLLFVSSISTQPSHGQPSKGKPNNTILSIKFMENISARFNQARNEVIHNYFCYNCYDYYTQSQIVRMKMSEMIKFFESKKIYLQLGLGKRTQDLYDAKAVKYNPSDKIKQSIPANFTLHQATGENENRLDKRSELKQIPNALKLVEGEITGEKYNAIKSSKVAQNRQVDICYSCYYEITKYHSMSGSAMHGYLSMVKDKPIGTRRLYPEINVSNAIRRDTDKDNYKVYLREISIDKRDFESKSSTSRGEGVSESKGQTKSVTKASIFKNMHNKQFALNLVRSPTKRSSMKDLSLKRFKEGEDKEEESRYGHLRGDKTSKATRIPKSPTFYNQTTTRDEKLTKNDLFTLNKLKNFITPNTSLLSDSKLDDKIGSAMVDGKSTQSIIGMISSPQHQIFYLKKRNPASQLKGAILGSARGTANKSAERVLPIVSPKPSLRSSQVNHRKNKSLSVADKFKEIDKLYGS